MASFMPESPELSLEDQIKTLEDNELLDFWEETQHLGKFLGEESSQGGASNEYERIIIQELLVRSCRRGLNS